MDPPGVWVPVKGLPPCKNQLVVDGMELAVWRGSSVDNRLFAGTTKMLVERELYF